MRESLRALQNPMNNFNIIGTTRLLYYFIFIIILSGCGNNFSYKGNKDLIGNWEGESIEIIAPSAEVLRFPVSRYGFSSLIINNDSTYSFSMEIMHDVILEKEVFGNPYAKTVLNAGFKNYKRGYYLASDTSMIFYDANKIFSHEYKYKFKGQTLYTIFRDKDNKQWTISWKK